MANRVVTDVAAEEILHGTWLDGAGFNTLSTRIQVGDIIFDTQTNLVDGRPAIYYNDIENEWSTARDGCTIWIDGGTLGEMSYIYFANANIATWTKSTTNPITLRPLGGQVKINFGIASTRGLSVRDCGKVIIDGENDFYPGLRSPFTTSNFLHGTFGFEASGPTSLRGTMCFAIHANFPDFDFNILGCEAIDGFAGFRSQLGGNIYYDNNGTITIRRCYRHDSASGEGIYIGYTGDELLGASKFNAIIEDNLFIRAAAESTQVQHTYAGSFKRNQNLLAASDWIRPFQDFQSNSWQTLWINGGIELRDNITEGWGDQGLSMTGSTNLTDPSPTGVIRIANSYFGWGGDLGYRNAKLSQGLTVHMEDLYVNDMSEQILERPDKAAAGKRDFFFAANAGTDLWKFKDIQYTTEKSNFFSDFSTNLEEQVNFSIDDTMPVPSYKNLGLSILEYKGIWHPMWFAVGFNGKSILSAANNGSGDVVFTNQGDNYLVNGEFVIIIDTANYDGFHQVSNVTISTFEVVGLPFIIDENGNFGKQITYTVGKVINYFTENGFPDKGFYKVIADHTPTGPADNPPSNPSNYEKLFWDVNAVRSDEVDYTGVPDPSSSGNYPPDNGLLNTNDKYFKLGMGIGMQDNDPSFSMYKWYIANDDAGIINRLLIYGAKELDFDINDNRYTWVKRQTGRYIVGSITPVDSNGLIGTETFATGVII